MVFTFGSVCSGIEGASVAWEPLGWKAKWFCEIEPVCCSLLNARYPEVPNLGDVTKVTQPASVDLVIGGTPCQSFSITGLRRGLDDDRGNLAFEFCRILREASPRWFIWENVAGVLSANGGRDFGSILGAVAELGYGFCGRVLDAQCFGVPQTRRRVFLVGHLGSDWRPAAGALFDGPAAREDGSETGEAYGDRIHPADPRGPVWGFTGDTTPKFPFNRSSTIRSGQGGEGAGVISFRGHRRRFTATELERLQGFPDGYTSVEHRGRSTTYRERLRLVGNSFAVPVVRWIGQRIQMWEERHQ